MSEPKPNGTDLFMAIVSGMSGPKASEGWTRQKLENDITWLASELTRMKDENARLQASLEKSDDLAVKMSDKISSLKAELTEMTKAAHGFEEQLDRELDKSAMLSGQVMRLTMAGDAMAYNTIPNDFNENVSDRDKHLWAYELSLVSAWNAAKGVRS